MSALLQFASGFLVGAIVMDVLWRILRRLECKLVNVQRDLIREQAAIIGHNERVLSAALRAHASGETE